FSISASVGIISTLGVAILGGVLLVSSFTEFQQDSVPLKEATRKGAEQQMRPVLMANLSAAIGLFPATVAIGIGSQAQQPLARVVVGGMLTAAVLKAPTTAPYHATFNLFNFSLPSTKTGYPFSPDGLQRKGIPPRHALLPMN
ncbi:MAG: efflux RND transporter permease subunit, partial [Nitrospirota bacterium]|nr:efflux RND transporter permease subunit [Nitrospirota bacterium]